LDRDHDNTISWKEFGHLFEPSTLEDIADGALDSELKVRGGRSGRTAQLLAVVRSLFLSCVRFTHRRLLSSPLSPFVLLPSGTRAHPRGYCCTRPPIESGGIRARRRAPRRPLRAF
jgi:hypothetical protein